jgi:hypothetical protein
MTATAHAFTKVSLPEDGFHLNGELYFTIAQIARFLNVTVKCIHDRCDEGRITYILQPGLRSGKRLVPADSLRQFLTTPI